MLMKVLPILDSMPKASWCPPSPITSSKAGAAEAKSTFLVAGAQSQARTEEFGPGVADDPGLLLGADEPTRSFVCATAWAIGVEP